MTLPTTQWVGETLPGGWYYLVDHDGNRLIDHDGNYLITPANNGTNWSDEYLVGVAVSLATEAGVLLATEAGIILVTEGGDSTTWSDE